MVAPIIAGILRGAAAVAMRGGGRVAAGRIGLITRLEGVEEVVQALNTVHTNLAPHKVERVVQDWIDDDFIPEAQRVVPVDTGELRDSIDGEASGYIANVHADAEHASYVEYGTSQMKAQPYMEPTAKKLAPKLVRAIGRQATINVKTEGPK